METAPAEQNATIKCSSEKRLAASRALPVRQPGGNEKVGDKGEREEKTGDVKRKSNFKNCGEEKTKHHDATPAIRGPGIYIVRVHPRAAGFV